MAPTGQAKNNIKNKTTKRDIMFFMFIVNNSFRFRKLDVFSTLERLAPSDQRPSSPGRSAPSSFGAVHEPFFMLQAAQRTRDKTSKTLSQSILDRAY
jgi:hypothetical protein